MQSQETCVTLFPAPASPSTACCTVEGTAATPLLMIFSFIFLLCLTRFGYFFNTSDTILAWFPPVLIWLMSIGNTIFCFVNTDCSTGFVVVVVVVVVKSSAISFRFSLFSLPSKENRTLLEAKCEGSGFETDLRIGFGVAEFRFERGKLWNREGLLKTMAWHLFWIWGEKFGL